MGRSRLPHDSLRPPLSIVARAFGSGDRTWEYIDLELDLLAPGNHVRVFDEDEFDEARSVGLIKHDEAAIAIAATATLKRQLEERGFPFDATLPSRLASARALALLPLLTPHDADVPFYN